MLNHHLNWPSYNWDIFLFLFYCCKRCSSILLGIHSWARLLSLQPFYFRARLICGFTFIQTQDTPSDRPIRLHFSLQLGWWFHSDMWAPFFWNINYLDTCGTARPGCKETRLALQTRSVYIWGEKRDNLNICLCITVRLLQSLSSLAHCGKRGGFKLKKS